GGVTGSALGAACSFRARSACRHSVQTGEKTAQTIEMVMQMRMYAKVAMTAPNELNALASAFRVGPIHSGDVAIVPPRTKDASSAPGRRERTAILRCRRKRGVQSQ